MCPIPMHILSMARTFPVMLYYICDYINKKWICIHKSTCMSISVNIQYIPVLFAFCLVYYNTPILFLGKVYLSNLIRIREHFLWKQHLAFYGLLEYTLLQNMRYTQHISITPGVTFTYPIPFLYSLHCTFTMPLPVNVYNIYRMQWTYTALDCTVHVYYSCTTLLLFLLFPFPYKRT